MSTKIDKKDKIILYYLNKDSRIRLKELSTATKIPMSVLAYRIKKLEENRIIKRYLLVIDFNRLGYFTITITFSFQYTTNKIEDDILEDIKSNRNVFYIARIDGNHDIMIILMAKTLNDFYGFWERLISRFRFYIDNEEFSYSILTKVFPSNYLLNSIKEEGTWREINNKKAEHPTLLSEMEKKVLRVLTKHPLENIKNIGDEIKTSPANIRYHIKNLINKKIITTVLPDIDFEKIGWYYSSVAIKLRDFSIMNKLEEFLKSKGSVPFVYYTLGEHDFEFDVRSADPKRAYVIINDLKLLFSQHIKSIKHYNIKKEVLINYLPELK